MTHLMSRAHRAAAVLAAAALLPLLAACSGDAEDPGASVDAAATDAAAPTFASPAIDDTGDPFCDLSLETAPVGQEIADKTAGMAGILQTALLTGDVATINAWGADLVALDERMLDYYAEGKQYVAGDAIEPTWDTMESFVRDYSLALAVEAASATDTVAFTEAIAALAVDARTQELMTEGPAAAEALAVYIDDRCDIMG